MMKEIGKLLKTIKGISFLFLISCCFESKAQHHIQISLSQEQCDTRVISPCGNYFKQEYIRLEQYFIDIDSMNFMNSYSNTYKLSSTAELQLLALLEEDDIMQSTTKVIFSHKMNRQINRFLRRNSNLTENTGFFSYANYNMNIVLDCDFEYVEINLLVGFKNNDPIFRKVTSKLFTINEILAIEPPSKMLNRIKFQN